MCNPASARVSYWCRKQEVRIVSGQPEFFGINHKEKKMRTFIHIFLITLILTVTSTSVLGKRSDGNDDSSHEIKGRIEQVSEERSGVWIVNGREITVTDSTLIDEEHGRAVAGASVEVHGYTSSDSFVATRIEVKRLRTDRK